MNRQWGMAVVMAVLAVGGMQEINARAGDPGDLFPSVPYDQALEAPSRPTRPAAGSSGSSTVQPTPVPVQPPVVPASGSAGGSPDSSSEPKPGTAPKAAVPPGHAAKGSTARYTAPFWSPYSAKLLVPLLSPEEKTKFNADYKDILANANASTDARVAAADALAAAAAPGKVMDASLRRYMLQQALTLAVKGRAPVATRESLAGQFLPLVESDHTLPATQAKATALETLAMSGTLDNPASPKLLDFTAQAYGDLALSQIEAGYPVQAQASLRKAETWLAKMAPPDANRVAQFSSVQYWLNRAQVAKVLAPTLKLTLRQTPDDPAANTQLATLHLSLFADVSNAAACAGKSDKAQFKALAKFVGGLEGGVEAVDPATPQGLGVSLDLCRTLLSVAPACADSFDRFAIATYVKSQADELVDKLKLKAGTDAWVRVQSIESSAQAIIAANPPPATPVNTTTTGHHTPTPRHSSSVP